MKNKYNLIIGAAFAIGAITIFSACRTIPRGVHAVKPFDKDKYMGKWFEIARFDFRFEKNLNNTTAEYSLRNDGKIKVVNRGFNFKTGKQKEVIGKAKFVAADNEAKLKVSFFGPFYSGYNVISIDKDYKYALVSGKNRDYLWILSRENTIPDDIKQFYIKKAEDMGFDVSKFVWGGTEIAFNQLL